jgi:acyl-[acyl carrier protein]--UDP-N-acetylglucosamine O-acyltransferase
MDRAGLNEQQQQNIFEAFKKLYRQGGALLENAKALADHGAIDENVKAILDSITNSSKHQFGRYLETFRH